MVNHLSGVISERVGGSWEALARIVRRSNGGSCRVDADLRPRVSLAAGETFAHHLLPFSNPPLLRSRAPCLFRNQTLPNRKVTVVLVLGWGGCVGAGLM
jgi:hypothetical protein